MELIDRYIHAIRPWLPLGRTRDEILRELSEDIRSEVDERRGAREEIPESELIAILKARGHPMAVAARFGSGAALIGPRFYPIFMLVARIVLGYVLLPIFAIYMLVRMFQSAHPFLTGIESLLLSANFGFTMLGVIVFVFVILERYVDASELAVPWDPRQLPRVRNAHDQLRWHAIGMAVGNGIVAMAYASCSAHLPMLWPGIENLMMGGAFPGPALSAIFDATWRMVVALSLVIAGCASIIIVQPALARPSTLVIAAANAILGALVLAAVLPYMGSLEFAAIGEGLRGLRAAHHVVGPQELGLLLGPAFDALAVVFFIAWGISCLVSAAVEGWRYNKLRA